MPFEAELNSVPGIVVLGMLQAQHNLGREPRIVRENNHWVFKTTGKEGQEVTYSILPGETE